MLDKFLGYSDWEIIVIMLAYFFAAFIKGFTGLGFTTVCLSILVYAVGLQRAIPLITIPALVIDIFLVYESGHFKEIFKRFWKVYVLAIPGVAVGLFFLKVIPVDFLTTILGILIVIFYFYSITTESFCLPTRLENRAGTLSGFTTGLLSGMTGSQLLPIAPFLVSLNLPREKFVQAINSYFTVTTIAMMIGLTYLGLLQFDDFSVALVGLIFVCVGAKLGCSLRRKFSHDTFRRAMLIMLLFSGWGLIFIEAHKLSWFLH